MSDIYKNENKQNKTKAQTQKEKKEERQRRRHIESEKRNYLSDSEVRKKRSPILTKTNKIASKSNLRAPIGPIEAHCNCSSQYSIKNILNQSEYELSSGATSPRYYKIFDESQYEIGGDASKNQENANDDFEIADDAISLNGEIENASSTSINGKSDQFIITVNGKEELPTSPLEHEDDKTDLKLISNKNFDDADDFDNNCNNVMPKQYDTFPKRKRNHVNHKMWYRPILEPPHRITPDGTNIYYWCDMPKRPTTGKAVFLFTVNKNSLKFYINIT